jgi:hypothetical protein
MTVPLGDASAATVEIVHAGQVITRVAATTKLLHDAVASIPDAGFREHPAQRRKELFKKIDALDKKLAKKDFSEAREILHDEIREDLLEDLINGYPTQSPLELSKDQILSLGGCPRKNLSGLSDHRCHARDIEVIMPSPLGHHSATATRGDQA